MSDIHDSPGAPDDYPGFMNEYHNGKGVFICRNSVFVL